jgi:hypothetical protein
MAILFWLVTTFGFFAIYSGLPENYFILYLIVILFTRVAVSIVSKQNILLNLFYLIPQQLALGFFVLKAGINRYKNQYEWKGRKI